jgi:hypothetical protein
MSVPPNEFEEIEVGSEQPGLIIKEYFCKRPANRFAHTHSPLPSHTSSFSRFRWAL